jgi:8-oxo-dGTP diphosphatase
MNFSYPYARPALCVDIVVFGIANNVPSLLVIQRGLPPFENQWALPGGYVRIDETLDQAAKRELKEETGLSDIHLEQLHTFSALNRDPRERTITTAYFAIVKSSNFTLQASTDAKDAKWIPLHQNEIHLAFDHDEILTCAKDWLVDQLFTEHLALKVLPEDFTLTQIQELYEAILNKPLDKRNFRKRILASHLIKKTRKRVTNVAYRSPLMYTLAKKFKSQKK